MDDDIRPQLQRPLEKRRQQRIVHNRKQPMAAGPRTDSFYIRNHHQRIGRRFDKNSLGIRTP
ncbi:hypothetical protein D3C87_1869120 [compost metagenome]